MSSEHGTCVFILVHGGWHGGWCWQRLAPLLRRAGYRVLTPDLPAHGADQTPLSARPWESYARTIADLAAAQTAPVILVGHSSGGMIISEVARQQAGQIAALVYLAAFLLPPGRTPRDVMGADSGSLLMDAHRRRSRGRGHDHPPGDGAGGLLPRLLRRGRRLGDGSGCNRSR